MPRDANGLYTLPLPAVSPGTTITSAWGNTTTDDLAASMSASLSRNGEGGMLAPLRVIDGSVVSPALGFSSEVGLGMYRSGSGDMRIAVAGNDIVRYTAANEIEVFRDGTWYPVQALPGYASSGLHTAYTGDLDDIARNSNYYALAANVTNNPPALTGSMQVETDFWSTDTDQAVQVATGMDTDTASLAFIRIRQAGVWADWLPFSSGGVISPTPPDAPQPASKWWDSNTGRAYIYYDDGTSSQWVEEDPPISDQSINIAESVFDLKLAGYANTGVHSGYTGDLDDLKTNSCWFISPVSVTNEPTDFVGDGFIVTERVAPSSGVQTIYGRFGADSWKQWMRTDTNGTWGAWKLVVDGGAFTERLDGYVDNGVHSSYSGDLNDIARNSTYVCDPGTITNGPPGFLGWICITTNVTFVGSGYLVQSAVDTTLLGEINKVQMRHKINGVWTDWKLVVDGGAFPQRLAGYRDTGLHEGYNGDPNDITWNSAYDVATIVNAPADYDGNGEAILITDMYAFGTNGAVQTLVGLFQQNAHKIWMRHLSGGPWGAWKLIIDGGAMTQRLAGYADTGLHENYSGDLDTILRNSAYHIRGADVTNEPADFNPSGRGILVTSYAVPTGTNVGVQIIYGMSNFNQYKIWQRQVVGAGPVWDDWKLVVDGGAFPQRLAGYPDTGLSETYTGDLNDIIVNSKYDILGTDVTNEPPDFVASRRGWVMTMMNPSVTTFATQVIYGNNNENANKIWMRSKDNGVWAAWVLVVNGAAAQVNQLPADLDASQLPTILPAQTGKVWNDGGVLKIS